MGAGAGKLVLSHDTGIGLPRRRVTAAGGGLQAAPIQNRDLAPAVTDQLAPAKHPGRRGDTFTPYAQHERHEFLSDMKPIGVRAIAGHQQPAGQPRLHQMKVRAYGGQRHLTRYHVEIAVQLPSKRRAALQLPAKRRCHDPPRRTPSLHDRPLRRDIDPEEQRRPQHAFIADESHLEGGGLIEVRDQRDEGPRGKEHVSYAVLRLAEYFGKFKLDFLAVSEQAFTILTR